MAVGLSRGWGPDLHSVRPAVLRPGPAPTTSASGQGANAMAMLADSVEVVIGVDTYKHTHTAAVVVVATGATTATMTVAATPAGYQQLLELAGQHGRPRVWAIESTGGYGAGLTRLLHAHHEQVVELDRPKRAARRHGPSPTRWMRPGPPARLWAATSWPSPGRPGH